MKTVGVLALAVSFFLIGIGAASADEVMPQQIAATAVDEQMAQELIASADVIAGVDEPVAAENVQGYGPVLLAQASTGGRAGAGQRAPQPRQPSIMSRIGWGLAIATVVNLATGNIAGLAWTWHAVLTAGGGVVGATTVAEKM